MNDLVYSIRENYFRTLNNIADAARKSNRNPNEVRLVVVTKSQPVEVAQAAVEAGVQILGENYPEEGVMKLQSLTGQSGVEWHMIGHVQSRKARLVADHFALLHSLDSLKLAQRLNRFAGERNRKLPVLMEFNVGGEESKYGWNASEESQWEMFLPEIASLLDIPNLRVHGLMTMPPLGTEPDELSMGTSADYGVAVEEGATLVRVGTAIVGARNYTSEDEA
jgi:pyridoxal phosphate enzyme (YggS family)